MGTVARNSTFTLESAEGPQEPASVEIPVGKPTCIGRHADCDVLLSHEAVSRCHCRIDAVDGEWCIADEKSRHGTYLNNVRLELDEILPLADGDLLRIGPWTFVVRFDAAPEPPEFPDPSAPSETSDSPEHQAPINSRSVETYATRATIFVRLGDDSTNVRELGWNDFTDRYGPVIRGFARNAGVNAQDADDILQDVLIGFFRVSEAFEYDPNKGRFRGYLKRITLNAIRARWRKEKHNVHVGLDDNSPVPGNLDAMWDQHWMNHTLLRALEEIRSQFEPKTIEAFDLYGRRGMSADAVAEQLGMTNESVRHAKSRVSRALRECIERIRNEVG